MTRTISLITATVGAALLFAVPAWGDNWGTDRQDQAIVNALAEDGFDDAVLPRSRINRRRCSTLASRRSASPSRIASSRSTLASEHSTAKSAGRAELGLLRRRIRTGDSAPRRRGREPVSATIDSGSIRSDTPSVTTTSSGTDIEWPQVGIGFGIGIVLALGLVLAMRVTQIRPFAH